MGKFFVGKVITSTLVVLGIFAFLSIPHALAAASFYVSPSSGTYAVGTTVSANVMIDSGGDAINAGEGEVFFSSDILEYQSISTSGSIFTFWTSGPSGSSTKVSFGGGLSNPGYSGGAGKVVTITWKAKKEGIGAVTINGNKILANDGVGTNLYNTSSSAHFTISSTGTTEKPGIASPIVQSSTHPNQSTWYNSRSVSLSWSSSGAKEYAYSYDRTSLTDPSGADSPTTNRTYDVASDGIWYFHVKGKTGHS